MGHIATASAQSVSGEVVKTEANADAWRSSKDRFPIWK